MVFFYITVDSATTLHHKTLPELLIVNLESNVSLSIYQIKNLPVFLGLSQVFSGASVQKNIISTLIILSQGNSEFRES